MPELPEVETIVRELRRCLPGRRIAEVEIFRRDALGSCPPQAFRRALVGATLSVAGSRELLLTYGPDSIAEIILRSRVAAAAVGLITLVGAAVQWISLRQSADK